MEVLAINYFRNGRTISVGNVHNEIIAKTVVRRLKNEINKKTRAIMKVQTIYVNLPVTDIETTRAFWTNLGFKFNEDFCDENTLALELNEGTIYAMLLKKDKFSTFTDRPIADKSTTQVLIAIQVESKDKVIELVKLAKENGGASYKEPADHGWMYYDTFADLDGHQWELMFADMSKMEN